METTNQKWQIPPAGLWGFSHCGGYDTWYPWSGLSNADRLARLLADLEASGANSFRPQVHWHQVEGFIADGGPARAEDVTEEMVAAYAAGEGTTWGLYDQLVDGMVARRIEPHLVVGAAYDFQVPGSPTGRAVPDAIGRERYIARAYLHVRAAVRRYSDRVHMWQLENELNGAGEMLLVRWRSGRAWVDTGFQTALLEALCRAVAEEDPTALRSHNFITDIRIIRGLYDWRHDVERWHPFLDIIGADSYPNYLFGWPSRGRAVGKRVAQVVEVARGKPVMVLECGYPVRPAHRGMSEGRQVQYARDAIAFAAEAGACGFYLYELCSPEGFPVEGPWSNRWLQSIEPWWGMVRKDDTLRPSFYAYREAMEGARRTSMGRTAKGIAT